VKRILFLCLSFTFSLRADPLPEAAKTDAPQAPVPKEQGAAAAKSTQASRSDTWQNWIFAGGALCVVAVGVIIVAFNQGENAH
jgi:hypothetical protein